MQPKKSLALAYALKRRDMDEMAGKPMPEEEEMNPMEGMDKRQRAMYMFNGGSVDMKKEYYPHEEPGVKHNERAMREDERDLNEHGEMEMGPDGGYSDAETHDRMVEHPVENQDHDEEALDMVGRIMKQRQQSFAKGGEAHDCMGPGCKHYSHGGKVANKDHDIADFEENEFDVLPKEDDLEFHYTGKNSGDELGNEELDEEEQDLVSRIMRSRSKKDRMPNPA